MIFKYPAYQALLSELGRNDYVVEIAEVAVRELMDTIDTSENPEETIKKLCTKHGVMLSYDKSNKFYNQITLGHIANVYHIAEVFFYDLQSEYNLISGLNLEQKWKFEQGTTKLDQILTFLEAKNRFNSIDKIDVYLIDTFKYYHQLRVYFSHKKTTSEKEIQNKWEAASKHYDEALIKKYRISNGPKQLDKIDFEDFFLFTQITKELALKISSIGHPEPSGLAARTDIKKLKKHDDIEKHIEQYLKTTFSFVKESDSDELVNLIVSQL